MIQTKSLEKIRMLGEKDFYKYLRILEVDTIKQADMKGKILKRVSQDNEKRTRNQRIPSEGITPRLFL